MVRNITQFQITSDIFQRFFFFSKLTQVSLCLQPPLQKSADLQLCENHLTLKGTWDALFASIWILHFWLCILSRATDPFSAHTRLCCSPAFHFPGRRLSLLLILIPSPPFPPPSSPSPSHLSYSRPPFPGMQAHQSTGSQGPGSLPFSLPPRPKEFFQVFCLPPVLYINKPAAILGLHRLLEENVSFMV